MYPQFKFDKHVKKCPVKPKSLLPIHGNRVRVCAKRLKWLKQGLRRKIAIEKEVRDCYGYIR